MRMIASDNDYYYGNLSPEKECEIVPKKSIYIRKGWVGRPHIIIIIILSRVPVVNKKETLCFMHNNKRGSVPFSF